VASASLQIMKRSGWLAIGFLIAFGFVLWRRVLFGAQVFFWHDVSMAYMPLRKLAQDAIASGQLPVWAPEIGCGFPVLAEGQAGVFYPLHIIGYLGLPYYHAYSAYVFIHCALAAIFMAWLCRRLGMGWAAGVIGGLIYGYSGFFITRVLYITVLEAAAWLPLIVCCVHSGLTTGNIRWFVGGAMAMAMAILAGHPQIVLYEAIVVVLVVLFYLSGIWRLSHPLRVRVKRSLVVVAVVLILGAGVAAAQLLPTRALAQFGGRRAEVTPAYLRELAMTPRNLAYMVHPYIFGSAANHTYFGGDHYYEVCGYAGALALPLAILGLCYWRRRTKWFALFVVIMGFGMALANQNPLYELLPSVPGLNLFRGPGRWLFVSTLGIAMLAAMGAEALRERRPQAGRLLAWLSGAGLGGMLVVSVGVRCLQAPLTTLLAAQLRGRDLTAGEIAIRAQVKYQFICDRLSIGDTFWFILGLGLLALVICGLWSVKGKGQSGKCSILLCLALAAELFVFGDHYNGVCNPTYYTEKPYLARQIANDARWGRVYSDARLFKIDFKGPDYRGCSSGDVSPYFAERETLRPNRPALWGLHCADGQYGLVPQRHYDLLEGYVQEALAGKRGSVEHPLTILRMLGVRYLLVPADDPPAGVIPDGATAGPIATKLLDGMPRCWVPQEIITCRSGGEALARIIDEDFDPARQVVVEGMDEPMLQGSGQVIVISEVPALVRLKADMQSRGLVVLNDAYNPNWQATIDGQRTPVLVANYILRGLVVPEGEHLVEFRYVSQPLRVGALLSLLSVLALCILWGLGRRATPEAGQ